MCSIVITDPTPTDERCSLCQSRSDLSVIALGNAISLPLCQRCLSKLVVLSVGRLTEVHARKTTNYRREFGLVGAPE